VRTDFRNAAGHGSTYNLLQFIFAEPVWKTREQSQLKHLFGCTEGRGRRFCLSSLTYWFCDDVIGTGEVLSYTKWYSCQQTKYSGREDFRGLHK